MYVKNKEVTNMKKLIAIAIIMISTIAAYAFPARKVELYRTNQTKKEYLNCEVVEADRQYIKFVCNGQTIIASCDYMIYE